MALLFGKGSTSKIIQSTFMSLGLFLAVLGIRSQATVNSPQFLHVQVGND